jgi:hypothetical protein
VTIITQDAVLATFDRLLGTMTSRLPASPRSAWPSPAFW